MLGDNRMEIIANTSKNVHVTRACLVSLFADCIHEIDVIKKTPGAYQTKFNYTIRYTQNEILGSKKGKPFLLKIDLFDNIEACGHRVKDFSDFCNSEKYKEFVSFLLEFTNLSQELFDIAQTNPTLDIPISFDVIKYIQKVKEKNNIDSYTFLSSQASMINNYIEEDKMISRDAAKNRKIKGVINK